MFQKQAQHFVLTKPFCCCSVALSIKWCSEALWQVPKCSKAWLKASLGCEHFQNPSHVGSQFCGETNMFRQSVFFCVCACASQYLTIFLSQSCCHKNENNLRSQALLLCPGKGFVLLTASLCLCRFQRCCVNWPLMVSGPPLPMTCRHEACPTWDAEIRSIKKLTFAGPSTSKHLAEGLLVGQSKSHLSIRLPGVVSVPLTSLKERVPIEVAASATVSPSKLLWCASEHSRKSPQGSCRG